MKLSSITNSNRANYNGQKFEHDIMSLLDLNEIKYEYQKKLLLPGIYGGIVKCDFYLTEHNIIIECKYQAVPGTVDEKYPYVVENLLSQNCPVFFLYYGDGMRSGAIGWLKSKEIENPNLKVFNFSEFKNILEIGI